MSIAYVEGVVYEAPEFSDPLGVAFKHIYFPFCKINISEFGIVSEAQNRPLNRRALQFLMFSLNPKTSKESDESFQNNLYLADEAGNETVRVEKGSVDTIYALYKQAKVVPPPVGSRELLAIRVKEFLSTSGIFANR